jgi:hypothetical protein
MFVKESRGKRRGKEKGERMEEIPRASKRRDHLFNGSNFQLSTAKQQPLLCFF